MLSETKSANGMKTCKEYWWNYKQGKKSNLEKMFKDDSRGGKYNTKKNARSVIRGTRRFSLE